MHPRIEELYKLILNSKAENVLDIEVLNLLKDGGATRTEAAITLHLGFKVNASEADDFVIQSKVWQAEEPNDVFYQTLKYLYYNPNDTNYEADDDRIQVSI